MRALADADPYSTQWRTDKVLSLWRLALIGDDPHARWGEASAILEHLPRWIGSRPPNGYGSTRSRPNFPNWHGRLVGWGFDKRGLTATAKRRRRPVKPKKAIDAKIASAVPGSLRHPKRRRRHPVRAKQRTDLKVRLRNCRSRRPVRPPRSFLQLDSLLEQGGDLCAVRAAEAGAGVPARRSREVSVVALVMSFRAEGVA